MNADILIDTNVLLLLVVGMTDARIVEVHERCSQFKQKDFATLIHWLGRSPRFVLLPNILTETSNLLAQIRDPYRTQILEVFQFFILSHSESYVESKTACIRPDFTRLRLTDCAVLETIDPSWHLLTVDFDLYIGFLNARRPVTNFRHIIDSA